MKLKIVPQTGGVFLAPELAEPGPCRGEGSSHLVEITDIPADLTADDVRRLFEVTADVTYVTTQRYIFHFDELGDGAIIRE